MPETYAGDDNWEDTVDLLLDGEVYSHSTFQTGEIKPILDRTAWLRARMAQGSTSLGYSDDDPDAYGVGEVVDLVTTTTWTDSGSIQITVTDLLEDDIVEISGGLLINGGGASATAALRMHDGANPIPGWRFTMTDVVDGGSSDGGVFVPIIVRYLVAADAASKTFTLQLRKHLGGDDGFETHKPWNLMARVIRA